MTVISSASGSRIDCDGCGDHASTPTRSVERLRIANGYTRIDGLDYCPRCRNPDDEGRLDPPQRGQPGHWPGPA